MGAAAQVERPPTGLIRDVAPRMFAMVVRADGAVIAWGQDPYGGGVKSAPVVVDLPGKALKVAVSIDSQTAYALLEDGSVVAWGQNDEGQLGTGVPGQNGVLGIYPKPSIAPVKVSGLRDIIEIGAGRKHGVALRRDGTVWAWGTRDDGVLGDGDTKPAGSLRVVSALAPIPVPGLVDIVHIAVGPNHNLALRRDGRVMSWGRNNGGELGLGTRATGWMPAEVVGLERIVAVAAGNAVTNGVSGAVRDDGTVWMWGVNTSAMMGNGQGATAPDDAGGRNLLPGQVPGLAGAKSLAIGSGHAAAILGDGTLLMWGHNGYRELGFVTQGSYQLRPARVPGVTNVVSVHLGGLRTYAVRADGTLWAWGIGNYRVPGVLATNLKVPTRIDLP